MAQKLFVKTTDGKGGSRTKEVSVIRSWQESDGAQIYLHSDGVYGYKDGAPVRKAEELAIIGDPIQSKMARTWWARKGEALSREYYARLQAEIEERQMDGVPVPVEGESSALDAITYMRRPVGGKGKKSFSDPSTWPEYGFNDRPDWWGHAGMIELGGYHYEMVDVNDLPDPGAESEPAEAAPPETF